MLYNKFENRVIVSGEIVAVDPIHIGSSGGQSLNPINVDSSVLKDGNNNPIIPGSSLKGVIRSRFEAVMRSLNKEVCNITNHRESCREARKDTHLSDKENAQKAYNEMCITCKLFGGKSMAGKIRIKDCSYIGEHCEYEKRDGVGIDRKTGSAAPGVKYDFEVIPKGSRFDFYVVAENLDKEQMKYFDFIIDMLEGKGITDEDYISVGGKTTRGLGRIKLENIKRNDMNSVELKEQMKERFNI